MEVLVCHITVGSYVFDYVVNLEVESHWKMLTDTAKITLPSNLKLDKNKLSDTLKIGSQVEIKVGYNEMPKTVFKGYLTSVKPSTPIELTAEDEMWHLKQQTLSAVGKTLSLAALLADHFAPYQTQSLDAQLGAYRYDNVSKSKVLEKLKTDFGLFSFFRKNTLCVGIQYDPSTAETHQFKLDYNMTGDDLVFKKKQDIKLAVKAVSNNPDGSKIEVEIGDKNGENRTLNFYNLEKKELESVANRELERLKYDGWRGAFRAFGTPLVRHGDIVELQSDAQSDKSGKYWVDKVVLSFGTGGFRQKIQLGPVIKQA